MPTARSAGEARVLELAGSGELVDLGELPEDERILGADVLRRFLLETEDTDPRGFRIKGAAIHGRFDLSFCTLDRPLNVIESTFSEPPCFDNCSLPDLALRDCRLPGLQADELRVEFDLDLSGVEARGGVVLAGARIDGRLLCDGATLSNDTGWALDAEGAQIGGSVLLRYDFSATGGVLLLGTKIERNLVCDGATLSNDTGWALDAEGAQIGGGALLRYDFSAVGGVRLFGAKVGINLEFDKATLTNENGWALDAEGANVGGSVLLRNGLNATGGVFLLGAKIHGHLVCDGATFTNENGWALNIEGSEIGGGALLRFGFSATGGVRAFGATVGSNLECDGATLTNDKGWALDAEGAEIGRGVLMRNGFDATGGVFLLGAKIDRNLVCDGGTLTNENGWALDAEVAEIGGGALMRNGFSAAGGVRFFGVKVGINLEFDGATLTKEEGWALDADGARVGGAFFFSMVAITGGVRLFKTACETLHDDLAPEAGLGSWAAAIPLVLEGFSYDRFGGPATSWRSEGRFRWLERTQSFDPGSWNQLLDVYRAHGEDDEARRTAIAMENDRLSRGALSSPRRVGRWILRITIGHGYRPWLALLWAVAIVVPFALLVWQAPEGTFVPTTEGTMGSPQPLAYSLDTFLPIVDLGEAKQWTVTGRLQWATWAVILLGWTLSTIFVAGFTRIVRNV
jgi:hypothetical protein